MRAHPYPLDVSKTMFNDVFVHITDEHHSQAKPKAQTRYHIIMLTGNPGCIGYYHEFLSSLWQNLKAAREDAEISIYGTSLSGFVSASASASAAAATASKKTTGVLGLNAQIGYVEECIRGYIESHVIHAVDTEHRVILVGHSVGGYIGLELIRRYQSQRRRGEKKGFCMVGYVGLWPTVTHLAQSSRGRKVGWLLKLPLFAFLIGIVAKILLFVIGRAIVAAVLGLAGFSEPAAEVTVKFLSSRHGVYQALYLAGDEMREITADRWDEDIWGAEKPSTAYPRPKLIFCFGNNDHWVANQHRDELIELRGRSSGKENWRPTMLIDETGIPHSFCINHSDVVAEMTAGWIQEIIARDQ